MATPYRPEVALAPRALGLTTAAAIAAALAAAVAWHLADRVIELTLVVPVAAGVAIGTVVASAIRRTGLPRPNAAATLAIAAVLLCFATQLALRYALHRDNRASELEYARDLHLGVGLPATETLAMYREGLDAITPEAFLRRRFGLEPDPHPASGLPAAVGAPGTIGIYALELLLAAAIAALLARGAAGEPACPRCGAWRVERSLGLAAFGVGDRLIARLRAGDTAGAAALLQPPDTPEHIHLALLHCPNGHDEGGVVRVVERRRDRRRRPRLRRLAVLELSPAELAAVRDALARETAA